MKARLIGLVLACGTLAMSPSASAKPKKIRTYTVQPGDSIWSIAAEFYGSGDRYRIIYKHNAFIGSAPHILRPGQVLTLPEGSVSPEAQVEWVRNAVRAKPPRSLDWVDAAAAMNLWKQYQVSTGDASAVHILFEDASDLSLGDNALLVIYGGSARTVKTRERTRTQVLLRAGTVRGGVAALDGKLPPMQVDTPSGTLEVNSTDAQIQCDESSSVVSVYEGEVDVKAAGTTVRVPKDQGTVVAKGKKPEAPTPLPPPPGWAIAGDGAAVAVVPLGGRAVFEAVWSPVSAARTYRIELARDARFKQTMMSIEVDAQATRFLLEQVPVGRYYARVSARDARKLQGRASKPLQLDVVGISSSRRMSQDETGRWEVAGFARLDLGALGSGLEWALDEGEFGPGSEPKRVIGAGGHTLRVRRAGQTVITEFAFHVLEIKGVLDVGPKTRIYAGSGQGRQLSLTVTDEKNRPVAVPDLMLESSPGGLLQLVPAGAGRWTAHLPAPEPPGPREILVRAVWPDGVLDAGRVEVERKLLEPYVYRWRESLRGLPWDGRTAATPLPSMAPIDRVGTETGVIARDGTTAASVSVLGELGLFEGDLALDAALTFFRLSLAADVSGADELGDAILGVRWIPVRGRRFTIAPSLRARLPLGAENGVSVGLEPTIMLRFRAFERLWLDTRQGVFGALGSAGDTSYIGDYALVLEPSDGFGLSAQLGTAVTLAGSDLPVAYTAGVGAHLHLGRVRLGLVFGLGLGDGGKARFGTFNGALTLDFGLGTP